MGGGPSTPALVAGAAEAGAVGFLAAGYKTTAALRAEVAAVREATDAPFGVNLFVPGRPTTDAPALAAYLETLGPDAAALGCTLGEPAWDDDGWDEKVAVLLTVPPAIVSFTFGCPHPDVIDAFRRAGSLVAVTVTTPEEAEEAAGAHADALCVQGVEAGAHRGSFTNDNRPAEDYGLLALIGAVARVTGLPQIATGGIMRREDVRAVLAAGAVAAQCGTAFLRCPESGASAAHKAALTDPQYRATTITRAFSGRRARGLANRFVLAHPDAPAAYPEINNATRPLRAAAAAAGDVERLSLWAGQGFRVARDRPAGEVVELLCS
jgi:nitronate monooxygenase